MSEWMGHFLFWEWVLNPPIQVRDNHLRAGGRLIPAQARIQCALVIDPNEYERLSFFRQPVHDLDFSVRADWPLHQPQPTRLEPAQLTPEAVLLADLHLFTIERTPERLDGSGTLGQTTIYGLCGWFDTDLTPDIALDTSPHAEVTHWKHAYSPLWEPMTINAGEPVQPPLWMERPDKYHATLWRWRVYTAKAVRT